MSIGYRMRTDIVRPNPELIKRLKRIPVANLDDNMGRLYAVDSGIKPFGGLRSLCGPAYTVKCPSGDNLLFLHALDCAQEGDILVISGVGNSDRAFSGELMVRLAIEKKIGGFVIDGNVRDFDGHAAAQFPVYARGIQANGPYKNGPGEINFPVAIGGQVVMPGDILVGDADGLVVIPAADAEMVCAAGEETLRKEEQYIKDYAMGKTEPEAWVLEKIKALNFEFID